MKFYNQNLQKTIFWMLCGCLAVDTLNGFMLRSAGISIAFFYKFLVVILMLLYLKSRKVYIYFISIIASYALLHLFLVEDSSLILPGLDWLAKFMFIVITYLFLVSLISQGKIDKIFTFATASLVILFVNLVVGSWGYGYAQYNNGQEGIGTRGFLYAGNELAGAIVASAGLVLMHLVKEGRNNLFIFVSLLVIYACSLATTKASVVAVLILLITTPFFQRKASGSNASLKITSIIVFPIVAGIGIYQALYASNLISRINYFYEKFGLITMLLSNRNVWAEEAISYLITDYSLVELLFGTGFSWWAKITGVRSVEIDFIDTLMTYGIVGVVIVYGFFFNALKKAAANKVNPYQRQVTILIVLLLLVSSTAGHIVFSGMAGPLVAAVCSVASFRKSNISTASNKAH